MARCVSVFCRRSVSPLKKPPFGSLSAVDLTDGKLVWQLPVVRVQDTGPLGIKIHLPMAVGMPTLGHRLVTQSGMLFFAGTQDYYLRAFDTATGSGAAPRRTLAWAYRSGHGAGVKKVTPLPTLSDVFPQREMVKSKRFIACQTPIVINNKLKLTAVADLAPLHETMITLRRYSHQHPELSNEAKATAALVAEKLHSWGYEVISNIGGQSVVGTLRVGSSQRAISLRGDMDALPIEETSRVPYASQTPRKMHAYGHDGHTAMLLGAACHLAQTRNFSGTLNLIFQTAEEIGFNSSAERMIEDDLFARFPCNAVFGMHNHPGYPCGTLMFHDAPFMTACDTVYTKKATMQHARRWRWIRLWLARPIPFPPR